MKNLRRTRFFSFTRIGAATALLSAGLATAFVAVNPSPSFLRNQQARANPASRPSAVPLGLQRLQRHLETLPGGAGDEASRLNGPEQERYDNIAYPNTVITETVRTKAAKAAKTLDNTSAPPSQKW